VVAITLEEDLLPQNRLVVRRLSRAVLRTIPLLLQHLLGRVERDASWRGREDGLAIVLWRLSVVLGRNSDSRVSSHLGDNR
jgi:hypothetical protein